MSHAKGRRLTCMSPFLHGCIEKRHNKAFYTINCAEEWEDLVVIDPEFYRPAEVEYLLGDSTKAKDSLGWEPDYAFEDLVAEMVEEDL